MKEGGERCLVSKQRMSRHIRRWSQRNWFDTDGKLSVMAERTGPGEEASRVTAAV